MVRGNSTPSLLALPYDVRFLIYQHLFPPGKQIYLLANPSHLVSMTPEHKVPTTLLLACRQLHKEASEHLYNHYLFNLIGPKADCLRTYGPFVRTVKKYARDEVHVDPFGNGDHSGTMCISVHTGSGKVDTLEKRQRGVATKIEDVRRELAMQGSSFDRLVAAMDRAGPAVSIALGVSLLIALLAWWFGGTV